MVLKYSFVGNAEAACPAGCMAQQTNSPNNNPGADGMASVLAHELAETMTDPQFNAWYDVAGEESADKCSWTFGDTYSVSNGAMANMRLGGRDFLIQRTWVNADGGYCAASFNPAVPSVLPVPRPSNDHFRRCVLACAGLCLLGRRPARC